MGITTREFGEAKNIIPQGDPNEPTAALPAPRTIQELLGGPVPSTGGPEAGFGKAAAPTSIEQLLANAKAKQGAVEAAENFPRFARNVGVGIAGVTAATATGGMSLLPSLLIESGAMAMTDFGFRAAGVKKEDEPSAASISGVLDSAGVGATNLVIGGALRGTFQLLGLFGGVGAESLEFMAKKGPIKAHKALRGIPAGAELRSARESAKLVGEMLPPNAPQREAITRAEALIDRIDDLYTQHAPLRASAQALPDGVEAVAQRGIVNMAPLRSKILALRGKGEFTPEAQAQDEAIALFADALPESMTLRELTNYIRGIRKPIAETFMKQAGVPVNTTNRRVISHMAAEIRDTILGDGGAQLFKWSSKQLETLKTFQALLVGKDGKLLDSAQNTWKNILNRDNSAVREAFGDFEKLTGIPMRTQAMELAKRRQWGPKEQQLATFWNSVLVRIVRFTTRHAARGQSRFPLTNPRLGPPLLTSFGDAFAGGASTDIGRAMIEGTGAAGVATGRFGLDMFDKAMESGRLIIEGRRLQRQKEAEKSSR